MEFISTEQFLEQDKEVQKVFLDWFNANISNYDLVQDGDKIMLYKDFLERDDIENDSYPLLTEGQLRKFIEDKGCEFEINLYEDGERSITIFLHEVRKMQIDCKDLLQAYWKVALEIAKESVANG